MIYGNNGMEKNMDKMHAIILAKKWKYYLKIFK